MSSSKLNSVKSDDKYYQKIVECLRYINYPKGTAICARDLSKKIRDIIFDKIVDFDDVHIYKSCCTKEESLEKACEWTLQTLSNNGFCRKVTTFEDGRDKRYHITLVDSSEFLSAKEVTLEKKQKKHEFEVQASAIGLRKMLYQGNED